MTANFPDPTSSRTRAESSLWSREQDKAFEDALARYFDTQSEERWEKIAGAVPEKDIAEVKRHYEMLIDDIRSIESGLVPLPCYVSSDDSSDARKGPISANSQGTNAAIPTAKGTTKGDQERRKGVAWTEEEHRLFLLGLDKFGKGDWRSISRNFVISRTPTQVASHAQKYFIRLNSGNKDRRRSSIHDITTVHKGETSGAEGPITGQVNGSGNTAAAAKPEQNSSSSSSLSTVGAYGTAVAQPIVGAAAVGTPVILPPPMSQVASGTPVNIVPVSYSVTQPTMNQ